MLINLAILGTNYQTQLSSGLGERPSFSIGTEDANTLRGLMEQGGVEK